MLRANPRALGSALFSALGLSLPLACGGTFSGTDGAGAASNGADGSGGSGASSSGTTSSSAGHSTTGGKTSGGGSGNTAGKPSSGGGSGLYPCDNPMPVDGGYERCENGTLHRPSVGECPSSLPRPA